MLQHLLDVKIYLNELNQHNKNIHPFPLDVTDIENVRLFLKILLNNLKILIFVFLAQVCMIPNLKKDLI